MPFTIGGEWIPESPVSTHKKPVKIFKEKRGASYITVVSNLSSDPVLLKKLCSMLKQRLACGGSIKDERIELQGDQSQQVKEYLKEIDF